LKDSAGIKQVVEEFRNGNFVIIVDDEDRENEGDLAVAAEKCTAEKIAFMAREGRGLICIAMEGKRLDDLRIEPMVQQNTSHFGTAFAVGVEAAQGTTTGISAADRATTVRKLIDPAARPEDFIKPGHLFPRLIWRGLPASCRPA
jgi:3,4-dihydroxy-2-butanone 4-phosphate synthase